MNKGYYAIIPATVRYDEELTPVAKLLYAEITALTNSEGYCWATNAYFAELYKMHEKSISRLISLLERKGYIRSEVGKKGYKTYRNLYVIDSNPTVTLDSNPSVTADSNQPVTLDSNPNVTQNTLKEINTKTNTKDKKINKKSVPNSEYEAEFETLWGIYPKKVARKNALSSYIKARKVKKYTYETIKLGLERYIEFLEVSGRGKDKEYVLNGSSFFNGERFNDEYKLTGLKSKLTLNDYLKQKHGGGNSESVRDRKIVNVHSENLPEPFQGF